MLRQAFMTAICCALALSKAAKAADGSSTTAAAAPQKPVAQVMAGLALAQRNRYDQAAQKFNSVESLGPLAYLEEQLVCKTFVASGNFAKAIMVADHLIKRKDSEAIPKQDQAETMELRADALSGEKKYDEAVQNYKNAAQLKPTIAWVALNHAGEICFRTGKTQEAIELLRGAPTNNPNTNGIPYKTLGQCYLKVGQPKLAIPAFQASITAIEKIRQKKPDYCSAVLLADYKGLVEAYKLQNISKEANIWQKKIDTMVSGFNMDLFGPSEKTGESEQHAK